MHNRSSIDKIAQALALEFFQLIKPFLREGTPEPTLPKPEAEAPISIQEVCALLKVSRPTLHSWMAKGTIPFHRKGRRVFLFKSQVLASLETPKRLGDKDSRRHAPRSTPNAQQAA